VGIAGGGPDQRVPDREDPSPAVVGDRGKLAPVSIHFSSGVFPMVNIGGRLQRTGLSQLEVLFEPPTQIEHLIVGPWRVHYFQGLP
jgi:hypothetical protein